MYFWNSFPFVRLGMALAIGILLYYYQPDYLNHALFFFALLGMAYAILVLFLPKKWQVRPWTSISLGFLALTAIVSAGYAITYLGTASNEPNHILNCPEKIQYYTATIISNPQEKATVYKLQVEVEHIKIKNNWQKASGKILVYLPISDSLGFTYGDKLLIKGQAQKISSPTTPQEFDFRRYMSFQQTYHQHNLKENTYRKIGFETPNYLIAQSLKIRNWADQQLRTYIKGQEEYSIATAICLGFNDRMDDELKIAYSEAGIMHLLAVSGMHVGIIYLMLAFALQWLNTIPRFGKSIFTWVIVLFLVAYAFLTGLTPSVLRAVLMFALVVIAKNYSRTSNIFNTIAVSIFILLCYDPYLLFSVSFQLSYLAVLGIIWFYPKIYQLYTPKNRIILYFYQILSMTLAAQLSTFPISLYYFHQFSNYFWLANLVILPFSTLMLAGSMAIIFVSFLPYLSEVLGLGYEYLIKFINWIIFGFDDLPVAMWRHLDISVFEVFLLYFFIFCLVLVFELRRFRYVLLSFLTGLLLAGFQWKEVFDQKQQQVLAIYHLPRTPNLHLIEGTASIFLTDSIKKFNPNSRRTYNYWIKIGLSPEKIVVLADKTNPFETLATQAAKHENFDWVYWKGKRILIWKKYSKKKKIALPPCDYFIVRNNSVWDFGRFDLGKVGKIIIDATNSSKRSEKLQKDADSLGLNCHAISLKGTYIENLKK